MIACPTCKAQNPDGSTFCETCGKPLAAPSPDLSVMETIDPYLEETKPSSANPVNADADLTAGTVFADRYTIESLIGRGGMGVVYKAKDSVGDRTIALKLIRSDLVGGEPAVKRLIAEGMLTQDIRHKNVVNVYNVGLQGKQPFVAMEFVEGVSLREWLRQQVTARTEVPLRVAARIVAEILDGLDVAHSMGIVHRDMSPENVMLTADPTDQAAPLKILDFGIARVAAKMESGTGTGLGKPRYMAPEQITNPDAAGPSADLYSLSVMFYELLVEVLPQGHWQPPSGGRSDVGPRIDSLIERGLSNRPASRPQSAKEYRQQLVDAVNNTAPAPPPRPASPPPPPPPGQVGPQPLYNGNNRAPDIPWESPLKTPWIKWTAIGCGGLIALFMVLVLVIAIRDETKKPSVTPSDTPTTSSTESIGGGDEIGSYSSLSGRWFGEAGNAFDMTVASDGSFTGSGTAPNGTPASLNGQFSGRSARYTMIGGNLSLQGQAEIDPKGCDFDYYDGAQNLQGKLHINHTPDGTCPR